MAKGLIARGMRQKSLKGVMLLGVELNDAKEEIFVRMVCDGLALGIAYSRAGFTSKAKNAAALLFNLPRVQERASKILEARRATGVVTLPQVTDMLQRVFAGAHSEGEYSAAHNAAFSLARLYGHVTDKSVVEHIRRPSRDPDAPSEQALESWAASLPVVSPPVEPFQPLSGPFPRAPADLLGPEPRSVAQLPEMLSADNISGPEPSGPEPTHIDVHRVPHVNVHWNQGPGLGVTRGGTGNGAPVGSVTGTPHAGGGSETLGSPSVDEGTGTNWPPMEDLF